MLPLTMMDDFSFLDLKITYNDGYVIEKSDFSPNLDLSSSPKLLDRIINGRINYIELSGILSGWDSLDLLIDLLFSNRLIRDIKNIDLNLRVVKDYESMNSLVDVIFHPRVHRVIMDCLQSIKDEEDKEEREILQSRLIEFLEDLFKTEISYGLNLLPYIHKTIESGFPEDLVPHLYTIDYSYSLDLALLKEDFSIVIYPLEEDNDFFPSSLNYEDI